jgi:hypothetical protein
MLTIAQAQTRSADEPMTTFCVRLTSSSDAIGANSYPRNVRAAGNVGSSAVEGDRFEVIEAFSRVEVGRFKDGIPGEMVLRADEGDDLVANMRLVEMHFRCQYSV